MLALPSRHNTAIATTVAKTLYSQLVLGMHTIAQLDPLNPKFPPVSSLSHGDLIAVGGNLEIETLCDAYRRGLFPWYEAGEPLLWWSPNPRLVLKTDAMHLSRSLKKTLKSKFHQVSLNQDFIRVITRCADRPKQADDSWITKEMRAAYIRLHQAGYAHSVEVYQQNTLVGGLYGVGIGQMFFGESMFSDTSDASKTALFYLCRHLQAHQLPLIDCQVESSHLQRLGAHTLARRQFIACISRLCAQPAPPGLWHTQSLFAA